MIHRHLNVGTASCELFGNDLVKKLGDIQVELIYWLL